MKKIASCFVSAWMALFVCAIARAGSLDLAPAVETGSSFSLDGQQFAKAVMKEKMHEGSRMEAKASVGSGFWVSLYAGYDFANLGALGTDAKNLLDYAKAIGDTSTIGVGGSGILAGGAVGYALDSSNSLSLSLENTWTSQSGVNITTGGGAGAFERFDPSLLGIALNYRLVVLRGKNSKTALTLGTGYYHGSVHYENDIGAGPSTFMGDFGQDGIGGTLGVSEELDLGGSLALGLSARFRVADFNKLTSKSVNVNGTDQTSGGPFALASDKIDYPFTVIIPVPTSVTLPSGVSYTDLDYTGFNGNVSLTLFL